MKTLIIILLLLAASQCFGIELYVVCKANADSTFSYVGASDTKDGLTAIIYELKMRGTSCDSFTVDIFTLSYPVGFGNPNLADPPPYPTCAIEEMRWTYYWHICEDMVLPD